MGPPFLMMMMMMMMTRRSDNIGRRKAGGERGGRGEEGRERGKKRKEGREGKKKEGGKGRGAHLPAKMPVQPFQDTLLVVVRVHGYRG